MSPPVSLTARADAQPSTVAQLLDVSAAAGYLGTSERFIRRLVAERRVPFHRVGRHIRFRLSDLEAFVARGRVEPDGGA